MAAGRRAEFASTSNGLGAAGGWEGFERRGPEAFRYSVAEFPLLPLGRALWTGLPTSVIHLEVALSGLSAALVCFEAPDAKGAGVVVDGELHDALWVDGSGQLEGRRAWQAILASGDGMVSACELDQRVAEALPILWRSRVLHRDLDKRWLGAAEFLAAVGTAESDRAVIVATTSRAGIALFAGGAPAGSWTAAERHARLRLDEIVDMLEDAEPGSVSVIERLADGALVAPPTPDPQPDVPSLPDGIGAGGVIELPTRLVAPAGPPPAPRADSEEWRDRSVPPAGGGSFDLLADDPWAPPGAGPVPAAPRQTRPAPLLHLGDGDQAAPVGPADRNPTHALPDYLAVIAELQAIGARRLGPDIASLIPILETVEPSVPGVRAAITHVRRTELPGHSAAEMDAIGLEMLRHVADRLTGA